jgi:hypothetical protein
VTNRKKGFRKAVIPKPAFLLEGGGEGGDDGGVGVGKGSLEQGSTSSSSSMALALIDDPAEVSWSPLAGGCTGTGLMGFTN